MAPVTFYDIPSKPPVKSWSLNMLKRMCKLYMILEDGVDIDSSHGSELQGH